MKVNKKMALLKKQKNLKNKKRNINFLTSLEKKLDHVEDNLKKIKAF